jgi:sortase (surface protein transpeptidase)
MQLGRRVSGILATVTLAFGLLAGARIASAFHGELQRWEQPPPPPAPPLGRLGEGDLVARVFLPRLGARFDVLEGVETTTLARSAGHVPDTALPGETGAPRGCLIAVPRDLRGSSLGDVHLSDRVEMKTPFGLRYYAVTERSILPAAEFRLEPGRRASVTIVTPYPLDAVGPAPLRLVITAEDRTADVGSPAPARRFSLFRSSRQWLAERSASPLRSSQLLDELRDAIDRAHL